MLRLSGIVVEDFLVHIPCRRVDPDLVPDTTQEGVVDQVFRIEVR